MHIAVLMAVVITAVFATASLVTAQASDHEDESTIQQVVPDLYDQKADEGDSDYFVVGNAMTECNQLGYDYGFKKDDPTTGFNSGIGDGMLVDYSFDGGNQGTELEWSSNLGIDAVILKASTQANVYAYDGEATEDAGLRTPYRTHKKRGKQYYGISHVTFCWDRELTVSKTADVEFTREYLWTIDKTVSPELHDLFDGDSADSTWNIEVAQTGSVDRDFSVTGIINVSNPWTAAANNVEITDALASAVVDCGTFAGTLSTGNSVECSYSADIASENDLPSVNVATATANGFQDQSATAAIVKGDPSIEVNPEVSVDDSRNDELDSSGIVGDASLSLVEQFDCDSDEGVHTNTASLIGDGDNVLGSASATVEVNCYTPSITKGNDSLAFVRTSEWAIEKSVSPESHDLFVGDSADSVWTISVDETETDSDFVATGTITVYNPNPSQALEVTISDTGTDADGSTLIAPAAIGNTSGSASVVWTRSDVGAVVGETLNNTASFALFGIDYAGYVDYSYSLDDASFVNPEVAVADNRNSELSKSGITGDASWTYIETFSCGDSAEHTNVASLTGDAGAELGTASATVEVNCYTPSITKTATDFAYTRTFDWDITKTVDVASHEMTVGGSATSNYSVAVTKDAGTDSGFVAGGVITVSNPHPTATLVATLSDPGAVLGTTAISVAPNGSQAITWSREDGDVNPGSAINSASFAAFGITYGDDVTYSYGEPTELIDDSIVVSDTNTAFGNDQTVSAGSAWNYPVTFTCDEVGSSVYPNVASFTGVLDSGSASVVVDINCAAVPTDDDDGGHETAFMLGNKCFIPDNATRWGWSYQWGQTVDLQNPLSGTASVVDGSITLPVYAGRGQCDETKGEYVGDVTIDGSTGTFTVVMLSGFHMDAIHIEHDETGEVAEMPSGSWTVAPGKYDFGDDPLEQETSYTFSTGSPIVDGTWLIVHLVSGGEAS
jgi:hypothetical protein